MKLWRFGRKLLWSKITGEKIPFQLIIHLTDVCNLRCKYCYIDFDHATPDLPFPQLEKVIREAREMGTERISLGGGEPLLRKDIGDIVNLIRDLDIHCNINTNGYLVPRKIDQLRRVNLLSVSLDGGKKVHDEMRGPGSFDKAIEAIRIARENGIKVHCLYVMNRANRHATDELIDLATRHDFSLLPTSLFFMGGVKIDKKFALDDDEYRKLLGEIYEKKKQGAPIVWSLETIRYVQRWPKGYNESNIFDSEELRGGNGKGFKPVACQATRYFCVMQTNGDLYSCDPLLNYGPKINALELGFREAFARTTRSGCVACNSMVCTEMHQLFSGKPSVIRNLLKNYARERR